MLVVEVRAQLGGDPAGVVVLPAEDAPAVGVGGQSLLACLQLAWPEAVGEPRAERLPCHDRVPQRGLEAVVVVEVLQFQRHTDLGARAHGIVADVVAEVLLPEPARRVAQRRVEH